MFSFGDAHHPQELVDVVSAVADDSAEYHEHVIDVQGLHDLEGGGFVGTHRHADQRDVAIVPGVVIDERGTIRHAGNLVAVVPPGHDSGALVGVLA